MHGSKQVLPMIKPSRNKGSPAPESFSLKHTRPDLYKKVKRAAKDLKEKGYAVIPSVLDEQEVEQYKAKMWDTLGSMTASDVYKRGVNTKFDRSIDNYEQYKMSDLFPHKHGILESYRMNHCEAARDARKEPKILEVMTALYGDTRLVCSMDRINWKFPGKQYKSQEDWPHCDQNPRKLGPRCVQAYLDINGTLNDQEPGNRFYEGSHLVFHKFTKPYRGLDETDWFKPGLAEITQISEKYKLPLVKPLCPAGSLVLWDSRTIHSPHDGTDFERGRSVFYVCYLPYQPETFTRQEEQKKKDAFLAMNATRHTPFPQSCFGKYARTYGKEDVKHLEVAPVHLFASRLKKAGYASMNEEGKSALLAQCVLPDEEEKLLFGFKSYSFLQDGAGLWEESQG